MGSPKFYGKSLTLLVEIMLLVKEQGLGQQQIANVLAIGKSNVNYYVKKAQKCGYIQIITRDAFKVLEVTQAGKKFLDQYRKGSQQPIHRAENIRVEGDIITMSTRPVNWQRIQMHNWVQYNSTIDTIKVHLNMGKKPTLQLIPSPVDGDDIIELVGSIMCDCARVVLKLETLIGLKVGNLRLCPKGEWLVYDPIARRAASQFGQVTVQGVGKVNASKPRGIGEFEFWDPRALADYMRMPADVAQLQERVEHMERLSSFSRRSWHPHFTENN